MTLMLVYFVMLLGYGFAGVERLCGLFSMRHFNRLIYLQYAKYITSQALVNVKDILDISRKAVVRCYSEELGREPDDQGNLDVDISFDGSWHTRGHKSLLGIGAVTDATTGLVLDFETLCKTCAKCNMKRSALQKKQITKEDHEV